MSEVLIKNVSKRFSPTSTPALQNIDATIPKGEIIGLVGPDGAGKSTLIRLMAGLLEPSEGTISVAGYDSVLDAPKIQQTIGYMPQKFGLYEELTVMQNLELYADLRGLIGEERKDSFAKLLSFTGLSPFIDRQAKALSGGMKQKLGLACALLKKPQLLLLDEPSVGVDPISRRELWKMVTDLLQEGISVIWSTSYLDEAERCNTVLLLRDGKLLYYGKPQDLTKNLEGRVFKITPGGDRRAELKTLLADKNVIDGCLQGSAIRLVVKEPIQGESIPPRFEDAFIDILGGGPGGESELANHMPLLAHENEMPVVAEHLTKRFGSFTAVDDISFAVKQGEIFGLLGPNGAGKTTTFRMLCGLLRPTLGKAFLQGLDVQAAPAKARAQIGYMAQKFSLYDQLSVRQNLQFFSGIYGLLGKEQQDAVDEMVAVFELEPYLNSSTQLLPLGFKQRLSLACATMHHPKVLFLDEPTSGIDPLMRREFWNHINGLVAKGITILVTTHFMDEAQYCDRIALIYQGQVIHLDTPDALKKLAKGENPTLEDAFIQLIEEHDRQKTS